MIHDQDAVQEFEQLLWQISQRINLHTRRFLAGEGLTMARFIALSNLASEKPFTMGDLQRRLYLAPATLTGLIDGLVEGGFVERWRDDCDRRSVFLALTPLGEELLERVFTYRTSILMEALDQQPEIDLASLNRQMRQTKECLKRIPLEKRRDCRCEEG
ncbi:MAG TPA: MarR family transcriptional regulator [Syntrophomonadaceae bacterium]|nr:MarR family transcriptional regulator [Syntrophomonadaceae bacterium]